MYPHFEEKNSTFSERRTCGVRAPKVLRTASTLSNPLKYFVNGRYSIFTTRGYETPSALGSKGRAMGGRNAFPLMKLAGGSPRSALEAAPLPAARRAAAAAVPCALPDERLRLRDRDQLVTSFGLNARSVKADASMPAGAPPPPPGPLPPT